jgi:hypothetical protein
MSRYGTFATCKFISLRNPANTRSELPGAAAALSVPGRARAIATKSPSEAILRDSGEARAITMTVTVAIGNRSRCGS